MSIPFFPSLRPLVSSSICFDVDMPCDDESELREMERDHVTYLKSIQQTANDLTPIGLKVPMGQEQDSEDEAANDDSEESDSHDEEEEEDMETLDNQGLNASAASVVLDASDA